MVKAHERLGAFFGKADLLIPDGIGIVLAIRWLHGRRVGRVPGVELMNRISAPRPPALGHRLFLFGTLADVNARAVAVLRKRYPGIEIVGSEHGYIAEADTASLVARIAPGARAVCGAWKPPPGTVARRVAAGARR